MDRRPPVFDRLLLIDCDAGIHHDLGAVAAGLNLAATPVRSVAEALHHVGNHGPGGIILIRARFETTHNGHSAHAELMRNVETLIRHAAPVELVVLTAHALPVEACRDLLRLGVGGFVEVREDRVDEVQLWERLSQARKRLMRNAAQLQQSPTTAATQQSGLIWQSEAMADLLQRAHRAAQVSDVPILISGESGTGKQLLAELIHKLDPKRRRGPFLSVNCSAIAGTLAESSLFGHLKGAFTGAAEARKGIFRAADSGTVLLDEIGEMDLSLQPKLLRVLQDKVVMPVGSDHETPIDVRVVAATNRPLAALVEQRLFRLDLFQRLNVICLEVPPLRERPEDIPALIRFFVRKYASYYPNPIESVHPDVCAFFKGSALLGNVRELENAIRQSLAFKTGGSALLLSDIPPMVRERQVQEREERRRMMLTDLADAACQLVDTGAFTLPELVSRCEELVLRNSLRKARTTSSELAKQLGLSRRTLYNKIRKYQLAEPEPDLREEGVEPFRTAPKY